MRILLLAIALVAISVPANALVGGFLSQQRYQVFYLTYGSIKRIHYYDTLRECKKDIPKYEAVAKENKWVNTTVACGLTDYGRWKKKKEKKTNGRNSTIGGVG